MPDQLGYALCQTPTPHAQLEELLTSCGRSGTRPITGIAHQFQAHPGVRQ